MTTSVTLAPVLLAQGAEGGGILGMLPLLLIGAVFFLMMRPQQKKARLHRELVGSVKQGDKVVAAGGIVGTIRRVDDDVLLLQIAENVSIKVDRASVARKLQS